jgi:hypothetical protein
MSILIPLLLFFVIFVCALWYHDVWFPPKGRAYKRNGTTTMIESKGGSADTNMQPEREHRLFTCPLWPTSKPAPGATLPSPGQKPLSMRTDQIVYACFDQKRGIPCVPTRVVRENWIRKLPLSAFPCIPV